MPLRTSREPRRIAERKSRVLFNLRDSTPPHGAVYMIEVHVDLLAIGSYLEVARSLVLSTTSSRADLYPPRGIVTQVDCQLLCVWA